MNRAEIENEVKQYWTERMPSFSEIRKTELGNELGRRWKEELTSSLPKDRYIKILDVGTGTGFFSLLLSKDGYDMTGIDLTPAMIEEAASEASVFGTNAVFQVMDAQELAFEDETFDAVISRNVTWTLPDPVRAYEEWFRVLKKGGKLINYGADYAGALRRGDKKRTVAGCDVAYGHNGVTASMTEVNDRITLSMPAGMQNRPTWDLEVLMNVGFEECSADFEETAGVMGEYADPAAPMFKITAVK